MNASVSSSLLLLVTTIGIQGCQGSSIPEIHVGSSAAEGRQVAGEPREVIIAPLDRTPGVACSGKAVQVWRYDLGTPARHTVLYVAFDTEERVLCVAEELRLIHR